VDTEKKKGMEGCQTCASKQGREKKVKEEPQIRGEWQALDRHCGFRANAKTVGQGKAQQKRKKKKTCLQKGEDRLYFLSEGIGLENKKKKLSKE